MPPVHHQRPSQLTSEFSGLNVPAEHGSTDHTVVCMRLMSLAGLGTLGWCGKRWLRVGIRVRQARVTNQAAAMSAVSEISVGTDRWISSNVPEGLWLGREEGGLYFP